jgi:hypothetical protein
MKTESKFYKFIHIVAFLVISLTFLVSFSGSTYAANKCDDNNFRCRGSSGIVPGDQGGCGTGDVCTATDSCPKGICLCQCKPKKTTTPATSPTSYFSFDFQIPNPTQFENLEEVISALGALLQPIFIITFAAMILYGAWIRLTSRGDAGKVEQSTKIIVAASIGFAIAVFAPTIVNIVANILGVNAKLE